VDGGGNGNTSGPGSTGPGGAGSGIGSARPGAFPSRRGGLSA